VDGQGRPRIAFYQEARLGGLGDRLSYLWCNNNCLNANNWQSKELGLGVNNGRGPDLELTANGLPQIAYAQYNVNGIGYSWCSANCESTSSVWQHQVVESGTELLAAWNVAFPPHCDAGFWDGLKGTPGTANPNMPLSFICMQMESKHTQARSFVRLFVLFLVQVFNTDVVRIGLSLEVVRHPALIVRPVDAIDVSQVVSLARETGMELAIRSGGHSLAGFSTLDDGIVLDLSQMKGLEINIEERTAWAEAGLTAGEYTFAAAEYGLATGFGDTASVGGCGLTIMPAPPLPDIPAEVHGQIVALAKIVYTGEVEEGLRAVAPFRKLAEPIVDLIGPMPYSEIYWPAPEENIVFTLRSKFIDRIDDPTAQIMLDQLHTSPAAIRVAEFRVLGGAMARNS
jgi:hypothetical protein